MMLDPLVRRTFELALFASPEEQAAVECTAVIWGEALSMLADFEGSGKKVWMVGDFGSS
jgi:hypothetical protein